LFVVGLNFGIAQAAESKATTIGILPFEAQSAGDKYSWLSAGISDTLIAKFTGTKGIRVLEREKLAELANVKFSILNDELTPSDRKPNTENRTQAAKHLSLLSAQYLLVGSYSVAGEQIRINARIVHAETAKINGDTTLSVKGKIADIFALETELAEKFTKACNLEVAYNKLSYTEGRSPLSYEIFNRGKVFYAEGQYSASIDAFVKAQQQNDGFYFAEAHTWEGKARIALGNSTDDQSAKKKVQQDHVKKFEADAAEAAPAFYDLGVALQACGQYEKAIKAYNDYLRWMSEAKKSISWEYELDTLPGRCNYSFYGVSGVNELHGWAGVGGDRLFFIENLNEKSSLKCFKSGQEIWQVQISSGRTLNTRVGYSAIAVTPDKLFVFSNSTFFVIDKLSGEILKEIQMEKPNHENVQYINTTVFIEPDTMIVVIAGSMKRGIRDSQYLKRFIYRVDTSGVLKEPVEVLNEEWLRTTNNHVFWQEGEMIHSVGRNRLSYNLINNTLKAVEADESLANGLRKRRTWLSSLNTGSYILSKTGNVYQGILVTVKDKKTRQLLLRKKLRYDEWSFAVSSSGLYTFNRSHSSFALHNINSELSAPFTQLSTLLRIALCYKKLTRIESATDAYERVLLQEPNQRDAYYQLGELYAALPEKSWSIHKALMAFDCYTNEPIEDQSKRQRAFNYLRDMGGMVKKVSVRFRYGGGCFPEVDNSTTQISGSKHTLSFDLAAQKVQLVDSVPYYAVYKKTCETRPWYRVPYGDNCFLQYSPMESLVTVVNASGKFVESFHCPPRRPVTFGIKDNKFVMVTGRNYYATPNQDGRYLYNYYQFSGARFPKHWALPKGAKPTNETFGVLEAKEGGFSIKRSNKSSTSTIKLAPESKLQKSRPSRKSSKKRKVLTSRTK